MKFTVEIDGRQETLEVVGGGTGGPGQVLRITRNGETTEVRVVHREGPHFVLEITEGEGDHVRRRRLRAAGYSDDAQRQLWVNGSNVHYEVQAQDGAATGAAAHGATDGGLSASIPAVVSEILVAVDQEVRAGEKLLLLESMKMILPVQAPHDGVVAAIHCEVGEAVQPGIPLIELQKGIRMNIERLRRLQDEIMHHGLDGLALVPGPNLVYISGIHAHLSERPLVLFVPADDEPAIIVPRLEASKAREAGITEERIFSWSDEEGYTSAFQLACAFLELSDYLLGVEALRMRVLELELLRRYAPGLTTAHAEPVLDPLRMRKDEREVAAMQRAARIAEVALERLLPTLQAGMSERQVAARLSRELLEAGSGALPFEPIVAFGANSAVPHAVPGDNILREGQLVLFDWGASVDGYASDITRTYALGDIDDELRTVYELVQQANEAGRQAARPGATGQDIDRATRAVIVRGGYGDYFVHRTGHGLGMEAHESPGIVEGNSEALPEGAVFTIEPGIYLPGRGGVRIEDDVLLTAGGHRSLTTLPRELITL